MSDIEKYGYDEKGGALEGPSAVDSGVYTGVHDSAVPGDGWYARFDTANRKLERKMGIESVSRQSDQER